MGNANCCDSHRKSLPFNEINTDKKKEARLNTDAENFDDIRQFKFHNIGLTKENLMNMFTKVEENHEENLSKIHEVSHNANILNIEVISSSFEPKGLILKITPFGYENSLRKVNDGITYFGYEEQQNLDTSPSIDYLIRPKEEVVDDRFIGQHFQIKFNPNDMNYYLKDLGHGFGTFIKITSWVELKSNFLISLGENYIVFTLGLEEDMEMNEHTANKDEDYNNLINIKIFSGSIRHGRLSFYPNQSPFIIGRSPDSEVIIDDNMLSRFHCTVDFHDGKWYIMDGIIENNNIKHSTNGTWIYAYEDSLISDGLTFKANHNLFICTLGHE